MEELMRWVYAATIHPYWIVVACGFAALIIIYRGVK